MNGNAFAMLTEGPNQYTNQVMQEAAAEQSVEAATAEVHVQPAVAVDLTPDFALEVRFHPPIPFLHFLPATREGCRT